MIQSTLPFYLVNQSKYIMITIHSMTGNKNQYQHFNKNWKKYFNFKEIKVPNTLLQYLINAVQGQFDNYVS